MSATFKQTDACCSSPPVVTGNDYKPLGEYVEQDGTKMYITGPPTSPNALLILYDIFGYWPQTLQGADILSRTTPSGTLCIMPDFFGDSPADPSWYPPQTPEHEAAIKAFFTAQKIQDGLNLVRSIQSAIQAKYPQIEKWGILGYCWGGFIALNEVSLPESKFDACVGCHPGFVSPQMASQIRVPVLAMLSEEEVDDPDRKPFYEALNPEVKQGTKFVEFHDMVHGWMSAKGDLGNEKAREGYIKAYDIVKGWLEEHLK
ncbi:MAG: hypothetical protein M1820_007591 [Bogoriella megaspora]|nr:MAG: hypothetical protein M1820_007591 [Bogoriella megaspora]